MCRIRAYEKVVQLLVNAFLTHTEELQAYEDEGQPMAPPRDICNILFFGISYNRRIKVGELPLV